MMPANCPKLIWKKNKPSNKTQADFSWCLWVPLFCCGSAATVPGHPGPKPIKKGFTDPLVLLSFSGVGMSYGKMISGRAIDSTTLATLLAPYITFPASGGRFAASPRFPRPHQRNLRRDPLQLLSGRHVITLGRSHETWLQAAARVSQPPPLCSTSHPMPIRTKPRQTREAPRHRSAPPTSPQQHHPPLRTCCGNQYKSQLSRHNAPSPLRRWAPRRFRGVPLPPPHSQSDAGRPQRPPRGAAAARP